MVEKYHKYKKLTYTFDTDEIVRVILVWSLIANSSRSLTFEKAPSVQNYLSVLRAFDQSDAAEELC